MSSLRQPLTGGSDDDGAAQLPGPAAPGFSSSLHAYTQERLGVLGVPPVARASQAPGGTPVFASRLATGLSELASQFHETPPLPAVDDEGFAPAVPPEPEPEVEPEPESESEAGSEAGSSAPGGGDADPGAEPSAAAVTAAAARLVGLSTTLRTIESCLIVLTTIALGGVLFFLSEVLVPLILAVFVASMLVPLVDLLTDRPLRLFGQEWCNRYWCDPALGLEQRWPYWVVRAFVSVLTLRLPNVVAMLTVIAALGVALLAAGGLLISSITEFLGHARAYEQSLLRLSNSAAQLVTQNSNMTLGQWSGELQQCLSGPGVSPPGGLPGGPGLSASSQTQTCSMLTYLTTGGVESSFVGLLEAVSGFAATGALIVMYVIFLLLGRQARAARKGRAVTYAVEKQLKVYILWKFAISMAVGLAVGTVLDSLTCDLAALFGVLTFGLNFIPTVGLLLAVVLPLPVVLLAPTCSDLNVCNGTIKGDDCDVWVPAWNSETHGATDLDMSLAGQCYKELPDPSQLPSADFSSEMQDKCGSDYCYCCGAVVHKAMLVDAHTPSAHFQLHPDTLCCGGDPNDPLRDPVTDPLTHWGMTVLEKIFAFAIPYLIQLFVSNFLEPTVFGKRLNLHPVVVLFALVFWYMMWGIAGAFLSVPIMSILKILALNMDNPTAQWFARLLEGQTEKATRSSGDSPTAKDLSSVRSSEAEASGRGSSADEPGSAKHAAAARSIYDTATGSPA